MKKIQSPRNTRQSDDVRLGPAPRPVPWRLRLYLALLYGQFAAFALGMGLGAFFAIAVRADLKAPLFSLPTGGALGTITGLHKTRAAEGGGRHSVGTPIYVVSYTYSLPTGGPRRGVSYAVGTWAIPNADEGAFDDAPILGRRVPVQYVLRDPGLSRIRGLRSNYFETVGVFSVVFLFAGLALAGMTRDYWRRVCAALARGEQDAGTGTLRPPPGQAHRRDPPEGYKLGDLLLPPVRDGLLQPPPLKSLLQASILPGLMLLMDLAALRTVFYP